MKYFTISVFRTKYSIFFYIKWGFILICPPVREDMEYKWSASIWLVGLAACRCDYDWQSLRERWPGAKKEPRLLAKARFHNEDQVTI